MRISIQNDTPVRTFLDGCILAKNAVCRTPAISMTLRTAEFLAERLCVTGAFAVQLPIENIARPYVSACMGGHIHIVTDGSVPDGWVDFQ